MTFKSGGIKLSLPEPTDQTQHVPEWDSQTPAAHSPDVAGSTRHPVEWTARKIALKMNQAICGSVVRQQTDKPSVGTFKKQLLRLLHKSMPYKPSQIVGCGLLEAKGD